MPSAAFLTLFYLLRALVDLPFFSQPVTAAGIALVHTSFNVLSTMLLFPFSDFLVRLSARLVPAKKESGSWRCWMSASSPPRPLPWSAVTR